MGLWPSEAMKCTSRNGVSGFPSGWKSTAGSGYNFIGAIADIDFTKNHDNATGQMLRSSGEYWFTTDIPALTCAVSPGHGRLGLFGVGRTCCNCD